MKRTNRRLFSTAIGALLFTNLTNATPTRLTTYNQLIDALTNGHRVNAVTEFKKCQLTGDTRSSALADEDEFVRMGLSFNQGFFLQLRYKNETRYSVSTIATNTIPGKVEGTFNRYKLLRVYDDNSATLASIYSDATNGKSLGWMEFTCKLSLGNDQNGVSLFDYDAVG